MTDTFIRQRVALEAWLEATAAGAPRGIRQYILTLPGEPADLPEERPALVLRLSELVSGPRAPYTGEVLSQAVLVMADSLDSPAAARDAGWEWLQYLLSRIRESNTVALTPMRLVRASARVTQQNELAVSAEVLLGAAA